MGGDLGGPAEMPAGDIGPEPVGDAAAEPAGDAGGGDDSALLAVPPGSRDVRKYEKSQYKAKNGTNDYRQGRGPRKRSNDASAGNQKASGGTRNVFPGGRDITNLAKPIGPNVGIYEQEDPTYKLRESSEEDKLFEVNESIRTLLQGLEIKEGILMEQKDENKA